jgi:hypothetical protein
MTIIERKRSFLSFMNTLAKRVRLYMIISAVLTAILGTLMHFFYEWSGQNQIVGLFTPVNESVWEHLKLLFFPVILFSVVENIIYGKNFGIFLFSRVLGIASGLGLIVSMHYTYSGIIGKSNTVVDMCLYFLGVAAAYLVSFFVLFGHERKARDRYLEFFALFCILFLSGAFFRFSVFAPGLAIFSANPR